MKILKDILESAQILTAERKALTEVAEEELDLTSEHYYILDVEVNHEWQFTYRHNSRGLVLSFANLYHAGKYCRVTEVRRELPGIYTGVVLSDTTFTPRDNYDGLTEAI